jgi:S-DNA-T family DNA segregation ATPase FtsK/SpoIIIE
MADRRSKKGTKASSGGKKGAAKAGRSGDRGSDIREEIYGVALCALAVALFIAVVTESSGVVPRAIAGLLKDAFGVGAYLVPVFILAWGITFFFPQLEIDELAIGGGLGVAFLSIVSMVSLAAPDTGYWDSSTVQAYGGYVGGVVAWALESLLGTAIAAVLLLAALVTSIMFATGFSMTRMVGRAIRSVGERREERVREPRPHRGARTTPLAEPEELPEPAEGDRPASKKRSRKRDDPEARRETLPTTQVVTPKAREGFELPPWDILERTGGRSAERASDKELRATADVIEATLSTFDIPADVVAWTAGPTVTMFEVDIAKGVKVHRVTALSDDLALALAAPTIRILAPIPGKSLVGIEVPNARRTIVTLGDVLDGAPMADASPLTLGIGMDVSGDAVVSDLAGMPHLLIAGSTGTGKSVGINAMLMSLLMRATPSEVRLILIDPKRIELNLYNGIPHLYVPVVTEPKESASALHWAVGEMETRLKRLQKAGARNIAQFNALAHGTEDESLEPMPYIVIVIDELADLMMVAAKEVEDSICRLAQLARAAGIHLIVATQRPSTDIITGLIKTNITHRIAFAVSASIDSRVIIDQPGAERLVGAGDMLFSTPAWPKPKRLQGALVTETEIQAVCDHLRDQEEPEYHEEILKVQVTTGSADAAGDGADDPLLWEAADIVVVSQMGSTSMLQRRLKVGYARAGRIMDMLEQKGVVGPPDGSKPREVLVDVEGLEALKAFEAQEEGDA